MNQKLPIPELTNKLKSVFPSTPLEPITQTIGIAGKICRSTKKITTIPQQSLEAVQQTTEYLARELHPSLGDVAKLGSQLVNIPLKQGEKLLDNVTNVADALLQDSSPLDWWHEATDTNLPPIGAHIYSYRQNYYSHHGIYVGDYRVVHYLKDGVQSTSIEYFSQDRNTGEYHTVKTLTEAGSPSTFSVEEIVRRAKSRLFENDYNLLFNNCEHFARWCRNHSYE